MELPRTPEGLVTPLAVVRAIQNVSIKTLAARVQVSWQDVVEWERGAKQPSSAEAKRLALALGWRWRDLSGPALEADDAWQTLLDARQRIAAAQ